MMTYTLDTNSRTVLESWAMQHFRNELWATILHHDPGTLPETTIQRVEHDVLADAQDLVSTLPTERLRDRKFMNIMIGDANSDTKDRLRKAAARLAWERQRGSVR